MPQPPWIGHVLHHLGVEDRIEALVRFKQVICKTVPVINLKPASGGVPTCDLDVSGGGVDADHSSARRCQGFTQQAAATSDVQHPHADRSLTRCDVAIEVAGESPDDDCLPDRIELVHRLEPAIGIPPLLCKGRIAFDFLRIDGCRVLPKTVQSIFGEHDAIPFSIGPKRLPVSVPRDAGTAGGPTLRGNRPVGHPDVAAIQRATWSRQAVEIINDRPPSRSRADRLYQPADRLRMFSRPAGGLVVRAIGFADQTLGMITVSMTWMTPFEASMSAFDTVA